MRLGGIFRGVVASAESFSTPPHRIRVVVPRITDNQGMWALPCWAEPASIRSLVPPAVGEGVWVMFEGEDAHYPVYMGFFGTPTTPVQPTDPCLCPVYQTEPPSSPVVGQV